jgi:hypothetical protein
MNFTSKTILPSGTESLSMLNGYNTQTKEYSEVLLLDSGSEDIAEIKLVEQTTKGSEYDLFSVMTTEGVEHLHIGHWNKYTEH